MCPAGLQYFLTRGLRFPSCCGASISFYICLSPRPTYLTPCAVVVLYFFHTGPPTCFSFRIPVGSRFCLEICDALVGYASGRARGSAANLASVDLVGMLWRVTPVSSYSLSPSPGFSRRLFFPSSGQAYEMMSSSFSPSQPHDSPRHFGLYLVAPAPPVHCTPRNPSFSPHWIAPCSRTLFVLRSPTNMPFSVFPPCRLIVDSRYK